MAGYRNIDPKVGEKTQFKPGVAANPSGPKPGYKHINTIVQELLNDPNFEAQIQQGYKVVDYKGAPIKAIVQAQVHKAINGDTKAYDSLVKSGYVMKTQTDITSDGERLGVGLSAEQTEQLLRARTNRTDI